MADLKAVDSLVLDASLTDMNRASITFQAPHDEIRVMRMNKQAYNEKTKTYYDDPEKAKRVDEQVKEHFGVDFADIPSIQGKKFPIYIYSKYATLEPIAQPVKFEKADKTGKTFTGVLKSIFDDGKAIRIRYIDENGQLRESRMGYAQYYAELGKWFTDPQKKANQYESFEELFGIPVENADDLVGQSITVMVQEFQGAYYGEITTLN